MPCLVSGAMPLPCPRPGCRRTRRTQIARKSGRASWTRLGVSSVDRPTRPSHPLHRARFITPVELSRVTEHGGVRCAARSSPTGPARVGVSNRHDLLDDGLDVDPAAFGARRAVKSRIRAEQPCARAGLQHRSMWRRIGCHCRPAASHLAIEDGPRMLLKSCAIPPASVPRPRGAASAKRVSSRTRSASPALRALTPCGRRTIASACLLIHQAARSR